MNREAIELMTLPINNDTTKSCLIRPIFNEINGTINNQEGGFVLEYRMFVDDLLSAILRHLKNTHHFIASSVELVYIFIGYPGLITKPDIPSTMSWGKVVDRAVGPEHLSLGFEFLNRNLEMTVDDYKVARLLELLNTEWSTDRKGFTTIIATVLISTVYVATITCTWLR